MLVLPRYQELVRAIFEAVAATVPSLDELLAELERPADAGEHDED